MKLEDLRPNASVRGVVPDCMVAVVGVQWFGSDALELRQNHIRIQLARRGARVSAIAR